ncbi:MAG: helicase RepA family protein [Planctomycetes bacterium]|nr:helicase RepA family protein [Planctomycetota bacterium]
MLQPLHRLAVEGVAVLLLHHPRKKPSEAGQSARGSGALLGFVDIVLELNPFSKLPSDACRRRIVALSRKSETPKELCFEWNPNTGLFTNLLSPFTQQFEENWDQILKILKGRKAAATHHDLLMDWPPDQERPSPATLYRWLLQAWLEKRIRRQGFGTRDKPWRFRLKNENDEYYDSGELPPLSDIWECFKSE